MDFGGLNFGKSGGEGMWGKRVLDLKNHFK
jgi:hypothetical protein